MRRTALICSVAVVLIAAGAFAFAASGGSPVRTLDIQRTARASSVHYSVRVRLVKHRQPFTLHISGASSRDRIAVRLQLAALTLKDGTRLPGTSGAILLAKPFLYERAPGGTAVFGKVRWLRLPVLGMPQNSQTLSNVRALTPSPLLRVVAESALKPTGAPGAYAGTAAYDDPVVATALQALGGGLQYRHLRVGVVVGRTGMIERVAISGRTADGKTTFALHARLYGYGVPVKVVPPKPGTFMDQQLSQLRS